jgi:hypothetical protein
MWGTPNRVGNTIGAACGVDDVQRRAVKPLLLFLFPVRVELVETILSLPLYNDRRRVRAFRQAQRERIKKEKVENKDRQLSLDERWSRTTLLAPSLVTRHSSLVTRHSSLVNSQQSTVNSQQSTVNSQQSTVNSH